MADRDREGQRHLERVAEDHVGAQASSNQGTETEAKFLLPVNLRGQF